MDTAFWESLAREVKEAQDRSLRLEPFTRRLKEFGKDDAYAVAELVHDMRLQEGLIPIGRKIGFTNPEMWSIYNVQEPIWGYLYNTTVKRVGNGHTHCSIDRFVEPKIEPEIVVHLSSAPEPGSDPRAILACIDWIAHGIEVVQSHYPGWEFQAADTIADWALHATLLIGEPRAIEELDSSVVSDLEQFAISLSLNGEVQERGRGSNVLGSPLRAVSHLVDVLSRQPQAAPLEAGELVTTGTLTQALPVRIGQNWSTVLDGIDLPGISVTFEGHTT